MNIEQIVKKITELEVRIQKLEQSATIVVPRENSTRLKISIGEFINEKKPKTTVDKTLALAFFYEKVIGAESFGTEDILSLWRQAKETLPSNINDLINKNVKKGLIAEEAVKKDGKKRWYVTTLGIKTINTGFSQ
jgi:hypothetical protein